ncbi:hypothetical protein QE394_000992 [Arthrobacter sp. SORGH_AS 212]|uniref:DUF6308 family protein n=1 Tax=Pseudarthrobacter sp. SORGH_AS 212 TaxID=3041777 RepID=UPI0027825E07|nr:hypothetical protein [Arthrobacter sp. SORGH_AS_0212]
MTTTLRVGAAQVDFEEAKIWATEYLVGRPGASAYPAYDGYPGSDGDLIGPQDLLAVALLNVSNKPLKVYYGLQGQLELLNERLQSPNLKGSLRDASAATLEAIADLFDVLEEKPADNVKLTTLSKVLHRKRPDLLPLFDAKIRYCYTDCLGAPVPPKKKRSKRDYRLAWLEALQHDLDQQHAQWEEIAALAPDPKISTLRALDIIGWELGRRKN